MNKLTALSVLLLSGMTLTGCGSDDSVSHPVTDNNAPVANADSVTAWVDSAISIDVLANDSDIDNDPLSLFDFVLVEGNGELTQSGNLIVFVGSEVGTSKIDYTIADSHGAKATATVTVNVKAHDKEFVGSQTCVACHSDKQSFFETGHNFKLNKVVDGQAPELPFTSLEGAVELFHGVNNSTNPGDYNWTWDDISYVIGGYHDWANFIDKDGYVLSGDGVAVAVPQNGEAISTKHIMGYMPTSAPDSQEFDCGICHSTGWKDYTEDSDLNPHRQDGMKGFGGTFNQAGVQCEACHGAGGKHVQSGSAEDIVRVAEGRLAADLRQPDMGFGKAATCSECHSKKTNRHYANDFVSEHNRDFGGDSIGGRSIPYFEGGRIAGDSLLGLDANTGVATGKKRDMACHTCHNPHASMNNKDQPGHEDALLKQCIDCHQNKGFSEDLSIHEHVQCTTCHMPKSYHFFRINLAFPSDDPRNFSEENPETNTTAGQYKQPWNVAKDSCGSCHGDDYDARAALVEKMHN